MLRGLFKRKQTSLQQTTDVINALAVTILPFLKNRLFLRDEIVNILQLTKEINIPHETQQQKELIQKFHSTIVDGLKEEEVDHLQLYKNAVKKDIERRVILLPHYYDSKRNISEFVFRRSETHGVIPLKQLFETNKEAKGYYYSLIGQLEHIEKEIEKNDQYGIKPKVLETNDFRWVLSLTMYESTSFIASYKTLEEAQQVREQLLTFLKDLVTSVKD